MWFKSADLQDLTFLADYEVWGGVPSEPIRLPGLGRYGRYEFDKRLLLSRCDLTIAQKRELIFLSQHFHKIDHFEFFELKADVTERDLKKAYFKLSKELHPDALRGKSLGEFQEAAQLVFEYGSTLYELLSQDSCFRDAYARVVNLRDQAFRARLEHEREAKRGAQQMRPAAEPPALLSNPTPADLNEAESRKEALRARLRQNQARHQAVMESRPTPTPRAPHSLSDQLNAGREAQPQSAKEQGARFFQAGIIAEKRKQWVSARGHFKLALQYAPEVLEYQAALERIQALLEEQKSNELWAQAEALDEQEQARGARSKWLEDVAPAFEESLSLKLDPERAITFANLCVERGFFERGTPWLTQACAAHPTHLNLKWALAQTYERASRIQEAKSLCQEMLSIDPSEPRAVALSKKYGAS